MAGRCTEFKVKQPPCSKLTSILCEFVADLLPICASAYARIKIDDRRDRFAPQPIKAQWLQALLPAFMSALQHQTSCSLILSIDPRTKSCLSSS